MYNKIIFLLLIVVFFIFIFKVKQISENFNNKDDNKKEIIRLNNIFRKYGKIEKKIHVTWKDKNILNLDFSIIKNGIKKLKDLNPEYNFTIYDDNDIEEYIKKKISKSDYNLIKDCKIVEKTDLWRLLKIYYEGGVYMDIDRFCNIPLRNIIKNKCKCVLPTFGDYDFSQDIMISCSKNIFFKEAIRLNLKRRREGNKNIFTLGPKTYFNAITKILVGKELPRKPGEKEFIKLRNILNNCKYIITYRENPMFDTILYQGPSIVNDKKKFYNHFNIKHWTNN